MSDDQADLPSSFTICSSLHNYFVNTPIHAVQVDGDSNQALTLYCVLHHCQVYKEDGTPWITFDMETQRRDYEKFSEWIR